MPVIDRVRTVWLGQRHHHTYANIQCPPGVMSLEAGGESAEEASGHDEHRGGGAICHPPSIGRPSGRWFGLVGAAAGLAADRAPRALTARGGVHDASARASMAGVSSAGRRHPGWCRRWLRGRICRRKGPRRRKKEAARAVAWRRIDGWVVGPATAVKADGGLDEGVSLATNRCLSRACGPHMGLGSERSEGGSVACLGARHRGRGLLSLSLSFRI